MRRNVKTQQVIFLCLILVNKIYQVLNYVYILGGLWFLELITISLLWLPQTESWWYKQQKFSFLTVLETKSPRLRDQEELASSEGSLLGL